MRVTTIFDSLPGHPTRVTITAELDGRVVLKLTDVEESVLDELIDKIIEAQICLERVGPEPQVTAEAIAAQEVQLRT